MSDIIHTSFDSLIDSQLQTRANLFPSPLHSLLNSPKATSSLNPSRKIAAYTPSGLNKRSLPQTNIIIPQLGTPKNRNESVPSLHKQEKNMNILTVSPPASLRWTANFQNTNFLSPPSLQHISMNIPNNVLDSSYQESDASFISRGRAATTAAKENNTNNSQGAMRSYQQLKPQEIEFRINSLTTFDQNLENEEAVELIRHILSKHARKRTMKELLFIRKCFKKVQFFVELEATMPEELILRMCKFLTYEEYPQFHRLYKAGDYGRKFFIIVEGSVYVLSPTISTTLTAQLNSNQKESNEIEQMVNQGYEDKQQQQLQQQSYLTNIAGSLGQLEVSQLHASPIHDMSVEYTIHQNEQHVRHVIELQNEGFYIKKHLEKGQGFGEIALRTEGIRTASIVCREATKFVSIPASAYQEILEAHYERLYKEKIDFLQKVSIFSRWSLAFLHEIMIQVEVKHFKRGDILYDVGERSTHLFFVRSGGVELQQLVEVEQDSLNHIVIPETLLKSNSVWTERAKNSKLKKCSLVILGPFQYFGDYEIFKKSKRITRAVCESNSEIFILEKKDFFENMNFIRMVKEIQQLFRERETWYQTMIQNNIHMESTMCCSKSPSAATFLSFDSSLVHSSQTQIPSQDYISNTASSGYSNKIAIKSPVNNPVPPSDENRRNSSNPPKKDVVGPFPARELFSDQLNFETKVKKRKVFPSKSKQSLQSIEYIANSTARFKQFLGQSIGSSKLIPKPPSIVLHSNDEILKHHNSESMQVSLAGSPNESNKKGKVSLSQRIAQRKPSQRFLFADDDEINAVASGLIIPKKSNQKMVQSCPIQKVNGTNGDVMQAQKRIVDEETKEIKLPFVNNSMSAQLKKTLCNARSEVNLSDRFAAYMKSNSPSNAKQPNMMSVSIKLKAEDSTDFIMSESNGKILIQQASSVSSFPRSRKASDITLNSLKAMDKSVTQAVLFQDNVEIPVIQKSMSNSINSNCLPQLKQLSSPTLAKEINFSKIFKNGKKVREAYETVAKRALKFQ